MNEITAMFAMYLVMLEAFREHLLSAECPTRSGNLEIRGRVCSNTDWATDSGQRIFIVSDRAVWTEMGG